MGTLGTHINTYLAHRVAAAELGRVTARNMRAILAVLDGAHGERPVHQLGDATIDRWRGQLGHLAPSTRRVHQSTVRGFCRWLTRRRLIRRDPTADLPPVRQPRQVHRALPAEAVGALLAACPDARARCIVWLMVGCGLRCVEVTRLGMGDYDVRDQTLRVVGKGGHERVVPIPAEVRPALDGYLAETGAVAGPLIRSLSHPHRGISNRTLPLLMRSWMEDAGIKGRAWDGVGAHSLRHTCASDVFEASRDLGVVRDLLGHASISTTSRYLRSADVERMRVAVSGRTYPTAA